MLDFLGSIFIFEQITLSRVFHKSIIMKDFIKQTILVVCLFVSLNAFSQNAPFSIALEPVSIEGLGGVQSFAFGQYDGKWLIVGGRLDGLHTRQPWAAFDEAGHNNQLLVIDPIAQQKWVADLNSLPIPLQEQLSSTNMQFYQVGDYLYCFGGYGYSNTVGDHITYNKLAALKVSDVINAIINGANFNSFVRQITDSQFEVTGGRVRMLNDNYYLLGGQKFIGKYNPMGPNHGQGFIQEYTNEVRIFSLTDDGTTITINHLPSYTDTANLHRRDYNAESQIMPNGEEGITMFSGVFQESINFPFLNCVNINANGYDVNNSFSQYYNHYHCPVLPLYSVLDNEMHTVFFGGIAQYYDSSGTLVQDDNVPFVKTIARVTREANGTMTEYKLPVEMPSFLGSGGEFILNLDLPHFSNEVIQLDSLSSDSTLVGYIYGGISSSAPNIFFSNDGTQSTANSQIFKVYLSNNNSLTVDYMNESSFGTLNMRVYPNPSYGILNIEFNLIKSDNVRITILDINGELVEDISLENQSMGKNSYSKKLSSLSNGSVYLITLESSYEKYTQKLVIKKQ